MRKTVLISVLAAAVAALAVGVVFGQGDTPPRRTNLAVFKKPQRKVDRLPVAFAKGPISAHFKNADSRLLGSYKGTTWYVVPGRHQLICLAGINGQETFGPCGDMDTLAYHPMIFGMASGPRKDGDEMILAGLANDGLTRASYGGLTTRIRRNVFFATVPAGDMVTFRLTGPKVPTQVSRLTFTDSGR